MTTHPVATEKVDCLAAALFVIGLALLFYFDFSHLAAGVTASIGIAIVVRQFLLAKIVDVIVGLVVFAGIFISLYWNLKSDYVVPILLTVGSIYYIAMRIVHYRHRKSKVTVELTSEEQSQLTIDQDEEH